MDFSPGTLKEEARFALQDRYGEAVTVILIQACAAIPIAVMVAAILLHGTDSASGLFFGAIVGLELLLLVLLSGTLAVGAARYFLDTAALRGPEVAVMFGSFQDYRNTVEACVLTAVFTLLWSLLLVVPGVLAALRYAMTPYILAVNPGTRATDALRLSSQIMKGRKRAYFRLLLSFAGWYLLGLATGGLGLIFIAPYVQTAKAAFFNACAEQHGLAVCVETDPTQLRNI